MAGDLSSLVVVALGSNLGDSIAILERAFKALEFFAKEAFQTSSIWRTKPVECPPGSPDFLNAAVAFQSNPGETPETLLQRLKALEADFGRVPKKVLNEPRPLDLDLILFGQELRNSPELILPHPRATQRLFVLEPMREIVPEMVVPGTGRNVRQLWTELKKKESGEHPVRLKR